MLNLLTMMNRLLYLTMFYFISLLPAKAADFVLQQSGGWFESAWVKWTPLEGADNTMYISAVKA